MSMAVETNNNDPELPQFIEKESTNSNAINKNIVQSYKKQKRPANEKLTGKGMFLSKRLGNELALPINLFYR